MLIRISVVVLGVSVVVSEVYASLSCRIDGIIVTCKVGLDDYESCTCICKVCLNELHGRLYIWGL